MWSPSKWLVQASPPDLSEARTRWTFGLYEILDERKSPVEPRVMHVVYRGVVELDAESIPDPADPRFSPMLEQAVVERWKALTRSITRASQGT